MSEHLQIDLKSAYNLRKNIEATPKENKLMLLSSGDYHKFIFPTFI